MHRLDWRSIQLDGEPERLTSLKKIVKMFFLMLKGGAKVAAYIKGKSEQEQWEVRDATVSTILRYGRDKTVHVTCSTMEGDNVKRWQVEA